MQIRRATSAGLPREAFWEFNLTAVGLVPEMVRLLTEVAGVIAMSDPADDTFVESAADSLAALLDHGAAIALVLTQLGEETWRKGRDE